MKKYYLFTLAAIALAGCTADEYIGENVQGATGVQEIGFNYTLPKLTRAGNLTGAAAAQKLNNQFIVWGEKNSAAETKSAGTKVFTNYVVAYEENTADKTLSNTCNWEYVGKQITAYNGAEAANSKVWPNIGTTATQEIKYWDYGANNYTFTAVSAKQADIEAGKVKITKTESSSAESATAYDKGYSIVLTSDADLENFFIADRQNITKSTGTDRYAVNTYGGNVTLKFRRTMAKVRVGFFETVPGYSVQITEFYGNNTDASTTIFMADFTNQLAGAASTLTVTYLNADPYTNQPKISSNATSNNTLTLGTECDHVVLGETSSNAVYDKASKAYTNVLPKEDNSQNLKLKVDYVLTSLDGSGETITVSGATAEVPANFMKWRANYSYTYLFKISNKTSGSTGTTGTDPAGLYPITFNAVVVEDADGIQETITTVAEPSITSYVNGTMITTTNEYTAGSVVYTTVTEGSAIQTLVATSTTDKYAQAYKLSSATATEAEVVEALTRQAEIKAAGATITGRNGLSLTSETTTLTATAIPGLPTSATFTAGQVANFTATGTSGAASAYAFVYQKKAATGDATVKYGEVQGLTAETSVVTGYYTKSGDTYTKIETADTKAVAGTKYYEKYSVNNGEYVVKVIKIAEGS